MFDNLRLAFQLAGEIRNVLQLFESNVHHQSALLRRRPPEVDNVIIHQPTITAAAVTKALALHLEPEQELGSALGSVPAQVQRLPVAWWYPS
mgnify:CR=1 FL=1